MGWFLIFGIIPVMDLSAYQTRQFIITNKESEDYGDWVKQTAKLVKRPYFQMHKIFEKENWDIDEIRRAYINATKHNGNCDSVIAWWANRKRRNMEQ